MTINSGSGSKISMGAQSTASSIYLEQGALTAIVGANTGTQYSLGTRSAHETVIKTQNIVRATFDTSGNMALGALSATSRLHVKGVNSTSANYALKVDNSSNEPILYARNDNKVGVNATNSEFNRVFNVVSDVENGISLYSGTSQERFHLWIDSVSEHIRFGTGGDLSIFNGLNLDGDSNHIVLQHEHGLDARVELQPLGNRIRGLSLLRDCCEAFGVALGKVLDSLSVDNWCDQR